MRFHDDCVRDRRTRIYLPVKEIIRNDGVKNAGLLPGNPEYQTVIHYLPELVEFPPGSSLLLDFGQAVHGGVRLNFYSEPGKIRIKFGESISETVGNSNQECSIKDTLLDTPFHGMLEYGNTVFRFVRISNAGENPLKLLNVMAAVLECDLEVVGSFHSSDPLLDRIWATAVRTVHLCMQDYIYDGAKRDRIVWMGDMHPEIKGILCAFADTSIIRDSLEFIIRKTPPGSPVNRIQSYSCWFIISLLDYFNATGDLEFLMEHREFIVNTLKTYSSFIDGSGSECIPERRFLDWPNNDNPQAKHAGLQALMCWMFDSGSRLLQYMKIDNAFAVAAKRKLSGHVPDPVGRKAPAALLTLSGLADCRGVLETDPFNDISTFYGYYVLLAKESVPALELIRRYWGGMLQMGATSFWEDFDLKWLPGATGIDQFPRPGKPDIHADFGQYCYRGLRLSLSHGWSCGPAPFLSERILGVRFVAPGQVSINPDPGDLREVCGTVPSPYGTISVEIDRRGRVGAKIPDGLKVVDAAGK